MTTCLAQPFPAHVQRFPNGLRLIHQELPATGVVAVDVWVGAGARLESDAELGVAHFLEHMVFKGTDATAPGAFDQLIEAHGGITNAATSLDYAHYSVVTAASHWQQPLITLADLLLGAAIPEEEFWRERQVVFEELRQTQDDPDWLAHQTLLEVAYGAHPYRRPILGTPESLTQLHPETLRRFHRHYYQPANMTVVVVGAVGLDAVIPVIEAAFGGRPAGASPVPVGAAFPAVCPLHSQRYHLELPRLEQARLLMAWVGPGSESLGTTYGLDLLATVLTGGRLSRLVHSLRETLGWVMDVDCHFALLQDAGLFTLSAWLETEALELVEDHIRQAIVQLAQEPISPDELARVQRLMTNSYTFALETPGQLASLYGYYDHLGHLDQAVTYPEKIAEFDPGALQEVAATYLNPEHSLVTTVIPA